MSRRASARPAGSSGRSRRSPRPRPRVSSRYSAMTSAPGRTGGGPRPSPASRLPRPSAGIRAVAPRPAPRSSLGSIAHFAEREADEARMRAKGIMIERDHGDAGDGSFARAAGAPLVASSIALRRVNPRLTAASAAGPRVNGTAQPRSSRDWMRQTSAAFILAQAASSELLASIARQASSMTKVSNPAARASRAEKATQ